MGIFGAEGCVPAALCRGLGGRAARLLWEGRFVVPMQAAAQRQNPAVNGALCWGGNNLPFQCCPTSSVLATHSSPAEYFVAFLLYTCLILAVI